LTIRPAPGAKVVFDASGDGDYGDQAFYLSGASHVTFDGSPGRFVFQHYLLAQTGLFLVINAHHISIDGVTVRHAAANSKSNGQSSHVIYVSDGSHDLTFNDFDVAQLQASDEPGGTAGLSGLHIYTGGSGSAVYNVTARNWKVDHANWALVARNATAGLTVSGWQVNRCGTGVPAAMDFGTNNRGVVSNTQTTNSVGTPRIMGSMTDGGANSWD
jgi:hypothetical protein